MIRVMDLPDIFVEEINEDSFKNMEVLKQFKHPNQLVVSLVFDPTSKFLATGTSDS